MTRPFAQGHATWPVRDGQVPGREITTIPATVPRPVQKLPVPLEVLGGYRSPLHGEYPPLFPRPGLLTRQCQHLNKRNAERMTTPPSSRPPDADATRQLAASLPSAYVSGNGFDDADCWTRRPNPARMYDYLLGGQSHYEVDRAAVDRIRAVLPEVEAAAWANRAFHQRAAIWMAEQGISQFVDIGCGLPTMRNTHEVVQQVNPAARVAYVDHDPMVITHAQALLTRTGNTSVILADIRDPDALLAVLQLDGLIEFAKPIGLLCTAVLHFVADEDDPFGCMYRLVMALASGSCLALSHVTGDQMPPLAMATGVAAYADAIEQVHPRGRAEVEQFFTGLEIIPPYPDTPGELCRIGLWGAEDPEIAADDSGQPWWAGVGRKPC